MISSAVVLKCIFLSLVLCHLNHVNAFQLRVPRIIIQGRKLSNHKVTEPYDGNVPDVDLVRRVSVDFGEFYGNVANDDGVEERDSDDNDDGPKNTYAPSPILAGNPSTKVYTADELRNIWKEHCIVSNLTDLVDDCTLENLLPLLYDPNHEIVLAYQPGEIPTTSVHKTTHIDTADGDTFITEKELNRKWFQHSLEPLGRPLNEFTVEDALQLIEDETEDQLLLTGSIKDNGEMEENKSMVVHTSSSLDDIESEDHVAEVVDENEYIVTNEELELLWKQRIDRNPASQKDKEFNLEESLLLVDDDEDDLSYVRRLESDAPLLHCYYHDHDISILKSDLEKRYPGEEKAQLRQALISIYEDLEDVSEFDKPWTKRLDTVTPDIDNQYFLGDLMLGGNNIYKRIPMNWDESEPALAKLTTQAKEAVHNIKSYDDPVSDYNIKTPIWDALNLTYRPENYLHVVRRNTSLDRDIDKLLQEYSIPEPVAIKQLSTERSQSSASIPARRFIPPGYENATLDDDDPIQRYADKYLIHQIDPSYVEPPDELCTVNLNRPIFRNHVGIEEWGKYSDSLFFHDDDLCTEEDAAFADCIAHLMNITDLYLTDHMAIVNEAQEHAYHRRLINSYARYGNGSDIVMPIPLYLTPDIDRGVNYTNILLDMKGRRTLEAWRPDPAVEYAEDSFTLNTENILSNMAGTVREQYDWSPTVTDEECVIDPIIEKILEPVIRYGNHAVKLKSTKGNIILFDYLSSIQQLIGIRATMKYMAKQVLPDLVDLRLETLRKVDPRDGFW